jgi:hypothetical protein
MCFFVSADPKQCKVWYKQSRMLGEWSDGLKFGEGTGAAEMLLVSATVLSMSPVEMPRLETGFDRNIGVHTQLDSSEYYKPGSTLWPHRPDVVIIRVCVHIVVLVRLHAVVIFGLTDAGCQQCGVLALQPMLHSVATTEVERPEQRSELTVHEPRPFIVATGS